MCVCVCLCVNEIYLTITTSISGQFSHNNNSNNNLFSPLRLSWFPIPNNTYHFWRISHTLLIQSKLVCRSMAY